MQRDVAQRGSAVRAWCRRRRTSMPGFQARRQQDGGDDGGDQRQVDAGRAAGAPSGVGSPTARCAVARDSSQSRSRRRSPSTSRRRPASPASRCTRRPEEVDAVQEADEQRRIAERRQRAADIGDQEDEEHDDMRRCARASSLARISGRIRIIAAPVVPTTLASTAPRASIAVLIHGVPCEIAGDQDAAGDGVEREQQHDEAHVFGEQRVHEARPTRRQRRRRAAMAASVSERPGDGDLAVMVRARTCGNSSGPAAIDSRMPAKGNA